MGSNNIHITICFVSTEASITQHDFINFVNLYFYNRLMAVLVQSTTTVLIVNVLK